jgi:hypothetical protein
MMFDNRLARVAGALFFTLMACRAAADVDKEAESLYRADVTQRSEFTTTGFAEATFYPFHDEYPANFGLPFKDEVTARYALTTDITVKMQKYGVFGRLYLFLPLGDTRPKTDYNFRADPILIEVQPTVGYSWTPHMDVRLTYDDSFDLGNFRSRNEVTPWLALSMRLATTKPIDLGGVAEFSGFIESFFFVPGFEYPATPGATPVGFPVRDFSRKQIVNARYALGFNARLQPKMKYLDRIFAFANPEMFFGDATLEDHDKYGGEPLTVYFEWGFGMQLTQNLDVRFTHGEFDDFGGAPRGLLTLHGEGISLRYSW